LLTYVLDMSEPDERRRLEERLRTDPRLQEEVAAWRRVVAPLSADRADPEPPADLAGRTIDFVFAHAAIVEAPETPIDATPMPSERLRNLVEVLDRRVMAGPSRWRRWDVAAVACMLLLGFGLALASIPFLRQRQDRLACQNQMRELHRGLETYSDLNQGRYPQVSEQPPFNTASSVVPLLHEAGVVPSNVKFTCPASSSIAATYAYSLGYREPGGQLFGIDRDRIKVDLEYLPILADRPTTRTGSSVSPEHSYGQNVLFVDGHVRFCTNTKAGIGGDEIYVNRLGYVAAGVHRHDTVLGYGGDHP
jgi:prepilin-type processing-associated H-X9-DG protein